MQMEELLRLTFLMKNGNYWPWNWESGLMLWSLV
jgi:hypothetical protein